MKTVRFHEFGWADNLVVEDIPMPSPEPDQIVVKIAASALNHLDVDIREGVSRFPFDLSHTPGLKMSFVFNRDEVEKVLDLMARSAIQPMVHGTFSLNEAQEAMETIESRSNFGKLLLVPYDDMCEQL